jgi:hypothetical protein
LALLERQFHLEFYGLHCKTGEPVLRPALNKIEHILHSLVCKRVFAGQIESVGEKYSSEID